MLLTSELRRIGTVPRPAASRPNASTATVTPVTLARRLIDRHHLVIASGLCAMRTSLETDAVRRQRAAVSRTTCRP